MGMHENRSNGTNGDFVVMNFYQEPHELRKQGDLTRASSAPAYTKAEGDADWEGGFENSFGQASNAFKVFSDEYMTGRRTGFTTVGDGRVATGDNSNVSATAFEAHDIDSGGSVRRTIPGA
ncbi:hypothetical protein ACLMAJ_26160 [Nocardia sp. KC 131]|uniref:hypothetical protein n=1 Tax=Nocardia arseniciresistens TaxID=3392119 RepID=UPI00398F807B